MPSISGEFEHRREHESQAQPKGRGRPRDSKRSTRAETRQWAASKGHGRWDRNEMRHPASTRQGWWLQRSLGCGSGGQKTTSVDSIGDSGNDGTAFVSVSLIEVRLSQKTYKQWSRMPSIKSATPEPKTSQEQRESAENADRKNSILTDPFWPRQSFNLGLTRTFFVWAGEVLTDCD